MSTSKEIIKKFLENLENTEEFQESFIKDLKVNLDSSKEILNLIKKS